MSVPKRVRMAVLASTGTRRVHRAAAPAKAREPASHGFVKGLRAGVFAGWTDTRGLDPEELAVKMDDEIDAWHTRPPTPLELHEYLGLTWAEYGQWMRTNCLGPILRARDPEADI